MQEKFQQMLQDWLKLPRSERWPVHLQDHISMFVYDCSGLLFVAFTLENMQPLQVFESLRAITVFLQAAFGGLTEEKVRLPPHGRPLLRKCSLEKMPEVTCAYAVRLHSRMQDAPQLYYRMCAHTHAFVNPPPARRSAAICTWSRS